MVSDTRSARNSKDERDGRSSKNKIDMKKDSSMRSPGKSQASGVRRSARETSDSKKMTLSPQSPQNKRKSARLEKGMPPLTPNTKRKSERLEKNSTVSPLRRSDRSRKTCSTTSSPCSRMSSEELSISQSKRKKEKNAIQVKLEPEKAELDEEAVGMKRKKLNARSYMALFKKQRVKAVPDGDGGLEGRDKLSDVCSDNSRGIGSEPVGNIEDSSEECTGRMVVGELNDDSNDSYKFPEGATQKSSCSLTDFHVDIQINGNSDSSHKDDNVLHDPCLKYSDTSSSVRETPDCPEIFPTNCSSCEDIDAPESESSSCLAETGNEAACEKHDLVGTCVLCSKNKRVSYNSPEQELCSCSPTEKEPCSFSTCKGRSDHEEAVISETAGKCDSSRHLSSTRADSQMDDHENICSLCEKTGELLCCDGKSCKRFYHICCLYPPLTDALPGVWHCPECVKKKLRFGVHSVSEGVESIWNVREVEVSNVKGVRQRQYLVKYHGLAHIHNHWVPEKQVLLENSYLVSKFIENDQIARWNTEWTVPHRLLRKRSIEDNIYIASSSVISVSNYEWLVKWHGLGYNHATWELDSIDCLSSDLGQNLVKDYEARRGRATNQHHKGSNVELSELPASRALVNDNSLLKNVNKLRECVFKCQNAVVFDDQERALAIIFFIQSMCEVCRPFVLITASSSLSQWEAEFARLVPSVDVVVYSGDKDNRKGIRASEFYDEGGRLMLQILLASVEVVLEDLDSLISIKWEAIVIDDYQQFGKSNVHDQIKMLPTNSRILLVSGQIKDTTSEYLKILSLLESDGDPNKQKGLKSETNESLCRLKDRLSHFIAYKSNSQLSKFIEYWVPVQISNYQLEQYCSILLNQSVHLVSCSRNDRVGALRDILLTARKCCVHPYLLDSSVQERLVAQQRASELLDVGIKASGKLELLDMILTEIKTRGLRVLVLFQLIIGIGKASAGNILEDFLIQRFGSDTYERVDSLVIPSEKQAAVNRFNKNETGQFVFLLENRACSPTIKLSSVDVVVVYDSDWNPANDIRALGKLSLGSNSKVDQIKIFRLYSSFTVEESSLVLAKQNLNIDTKFENFSRITSDTLQSFVSWGAVHLFSKLDKYHADEKSTSEFSFSSGQLLHGEVTKEFQALLSGNTDSSSVISKVKLGVGSYSSNIPLLGETKVQLKDGEEPHLFWRNLLHGKNYKWRHLRGPSPRNRKRISYFDGSPSKSATERDGVVKKRKKIVDDKLDPPLVQVAASAEGPSTIKACNQSENMQKDSNTSKNIPNGMCGHNSFGAGVSEIRSDERIASCDERKTLHNSLQTEMTRLCQVLKFSKDVTDIVLRFLEYVIKNRDVNSDSQSVVQALQISLCWIAASITKTKIDKKDSLMSAKQLLNYQCTEEQANSVYLILKEMYSQSLGKIVNPGRSYPLAEEGFSKGKADVSNRDASIKKLYKKIKKRMRKLLHNHQKELEKLHQKWDKERIKIETDHKLESAFIRSVHGQGSIGIDKLKLLDNELTTKIASLGLEKDMELKDVEAKHLLDIDEEKRKTAQWLNAAKANCIGPGAVNGARSLGPEPEDHVVEGPQPSTPPPDEEIGCETRVENLVTVDSQNEVEISSLAVTENFNHSNRSSDNDETIIVNPVEGCKIASTDALVDEAASGCLQSPSLSPRQQPSLQSTEVPDCCDLSAQQVRQDKTDQSLVPAEPQNLDQQIPENPNTSEIEAEPTNDIDPVTPGHEPPVTNQTVTPSLSTLEAPVTNETVNTSPSNLEAEVIESCNKSSGIDENDQGRSSSPQTAGPGGTGVLSHEPVPEDSDIHNNHVNTVPVGSVTNGQSVELSPVSHTPHVNGVSNQAVLQLGNDVGHIGSSHPSLLADPLQNELDNLQRESEQLDRYHKDVSSKLKSECEKEIQEMITQIRNKYEAKLQENEAEFRLKKNELDKNQNKVFMNKILAAAFRFKCSNHRPAMVPGVPSNFMHHHMSMSPPTRPSSCPPPAAATQPIRTYQQPRPHSARPPSTILNQTGPTRPAVRCPTIVSQNVSSPSVQTVQNTAALFSSVAPPRPPPLISTITPLRNSRPGGEVRSAAPHLQSFRPPPPTPQSVPRTPLQRLPTPPLPTASPWRLPPPPPPGFNKSVVSQNSDKRSPATPGGLVADADRTDDNNRGALSDLPKICSTFGSLEQSDLEILGNNTEGNQAPSSVREDLVCLSDDE